MIISKKEWKRKNFPNGYNERVLKLIWDQYENAHLKKIGLEQINGAQNIEMR